MVLKYLQGINPITTLNSIITQLKQLRINSLFFFFQTQVITPKNPNKQNYTSNVFFVMCKFLYISYNLYIISSMSFPLWFSWFCVFFPLVTGYGSHHSHHFWTNSIKLTMETRLHSTTVSCKWWYLCLLF